MKYPLWCNRITVHGDKMHRLHLRLATMRKSPGILQTLPYVIVCCILVTLFVIINVHLTGKMNGPSSRRSSSNHRLWTTIEESTPTCTPHQHIMFLKMHKCASSSLQNMFIRYAIENNLTLALSLRENHLGNPKPFQAHMVPKEQLAATGAVDIFAIHTRLAKSELLKVLHPDTVFVTAVRKPESLFESLYSYSKLDNTTGLSFEEFIDLPLEKQLSYERRDHRFGHNMMLFDLGVDPTIDMTMFEIRKVIDDADALFHLVLIAEKLDEGLILLKELLCWGLDDMIAYTKNKRRDSVKKVLSARIITKLRELNSGDALLYSHFLARHEEAVRRYGHQKMAEQVAILQRRRQEIFDACGTRVADSSRNISKDFRDYSDQVNSFVVGPEADKTCILMSLPELQMINYTREIQHSRLKVSSLATKIKT